MRSVWPRCLIGLCLLAAGCTPLANTARTIFVEPLCYWGPLDGLIECVRNRHLADEALADYQACQPFQAFSDDFDHGFKEGFNDFLLFGGSGEPPPLPPRCYWRPKYQTAEGNAAIQDWFEGFRQGARAARDSGQRQWVILPSSLAAPAEERIGPIAPPRPVEIDGPIPLPPPRPVPAADPVTIKIPGPPQPVLPVLPPITAAPPPGAEQTRSMLILKVPVPLNRTEAEIVPEATVQSGLPVSTPAPIIRVGFIPGAR